MECIHTLYIIKYIIKLDNCKEYTRRFLYYHKQIMILIPVQCPAEILDLWMVTLISSKTRLGTIKHTHTHRFWTDSFCSVERNFIENRNRYIQKQKLNAHFVL